MRHSRSVHCPKSRAAGVEEALGVAPALAVAPPPRGTPRRGRRSPSSGGRGRTRDRSGRGVIADLRRATPDAIACGRRHARAESVADDERDRSDRRRPRQARRARSCDARPAPSRRPRCRRGARARPARWHRRASGAALAQQPRDLVGVDVLVHAVAASTSISPSRSATAAHVGRVTAPLPTMRAGSSGEPPGGGVSRRWR